MVVGSTGGGSRAVAASVALAVAGCGSVVVPPEGADGGAGPVKITVAVTGEGRVTSTPSGLDCPGACELEVAAGTRVTLEATPSSGAAFAGFDVPACGAAAQCSFDAVTDQAITARFEAPQARLTIVKQGDGAGRITSAPMGIDCGAACDGTWPVGTEVTLSAAPDGESRFASWSAPCGAVTGDCTFTLEADLEVRATFDDRFATLSVLFAGSGRGEVRSDVGGLVCTSTASSCEATFEIPTTVTLTATPDPMTTFTGWSDSTVCSGRQPCAIPLRRSQTVTATFEGITHTLTVSRSGPGRGRVAGGAIDCGATCTAPVAAGTTLDLTAEPARHYRFVRWTGACVGATTTCRLTMDSPKNVDAEFEFEPQLATGFRHACATSTDGRLRCWGANDHGQLGYGHTIDVGATPSRTALTEGDVPIDVPVEAVALGYDHTCVVTRDGGVICWGLGDAGQLGYGDVMSRGGSGATVPRLIGSVDIGESVVDVTAGLEHTCALTSGGSVSCWGSNTMGQLGYGSLERVGHEGGSIPRTAGAVPVGAPVASIIAGAFFTCAQTTSGGLRCWGNSDFGQLGYGNTDTVGAGTNNTPAAAGDVPTGDTVEAVYESLGAHACAGFEGGAIRCWGLGLDGRTGYGNQNDIGATPGSTPATAGAVSVGEPVVDLFAGAAHTCALTSAGTLRCWGDGNEGQLGYGNPDQLGDTPATVPSNNGDVPTGGVVEKIGAGNQYTCARYRNGEIKCWGACLRGVCGYGDQTYRGATPSTTPANLPAVPVF